jgi:hypothetical protein
MRCNTFQFITNIKSDTVVLTCFASTVNMKITPQASLKVKKEIIVTQSL